MGIIKDKLTEFSNPIYAYDQFCKILGVSSGGSVLLMCIGDIYVHPTLSDSLPRHRRLLKLFLDNFMSGPQARDVVSHIGNSFLSAAPAIAITMLGEVGRYYGEKSGNKTLLAVANASPILAMATVAGANYLEEMSATQLDPLEASGDMEYGLIAGELGTIATLCADIPQLIRTHRTPAPPRFQSSPAHYGNSGRSLTSASS